MLDGLEWRPRVDRGGHLRVAQVKMMVWIERGDNEVDLRDDLNVQNGEVG